MVALVEEAITTIRDLGSSLRPPMLDDLGAAAAIEWSVQGLAARTGIACELDVAADPLDLDADQTTAVFRIAQEALTNVARHAEADRCEISLHVVDGKLLLRVIDNGKGIAAEHLAGAGSLGLLGMRERALAVGGDLEVRRVPEGGTEVALSFRLKPAEKG